MALDAQIVIMAEPYVRDALDELAEQYGLSRSAVTRLAVRHGLPVVRAALAGERAALSTRTETAATGS